MTRSSKYLKASEWPRVFREYDKWIQSNFEGSSPESRAWLQAFEANLQTGKIAFRAEPYQREAILRFIYSLEFHTRFQSDDLLPLNRLAVKMATGSGKTLVMAHVISWAKAVASAEIGAYRFLLLTPNTIVRERVWADFGGQENIFYAAGLSSDGIDPVNLSEIDGAYFSSKTLWLTNIHQVFAKSRKGSGLLNYLNESDERFMVINDEAHNSVTAEYSDLMETLQSLDNFAGRIDVTATPRRPDLLEIPSHFIFEFEPVMGIEGVGTYRFDQIGQPLEEADSLRNKAWDRQSGRAILKQPIIHRIAPEKAKFSVKESGKKKEVSVSGAELRLLLAKSDELTKAEKESQGDLLARLEKEHKVDLKKSLKRSVIVSDPPFRESMLTKGLELLDLAASEAPQGEMPYKPILFAVAISRADAREAAKFLELKGKRALVVVGSDDKPVGTTEANEGDADSFTLEDGSGNKLDKKVLREIASRVGKGQDYFEFEGENHFCGYDAVVSVYMLKEGWDTNAVEVMVLLRPFDSMLFAEQTVGRGLRIRRDLKDAQQNLRVVETSAWTLDDLWRALGAVQNPTDHSALKEITRLQFDTKLQQSVRVEKAREIAANDITDENLSKQLLAQLGSSESSDFDRGEILEVCLENRRMSRKEALTYLREEARVEEPDNEILERVCKEIRSPSIREELLSAINEEDYDKIEAIIRGDDKTSQPEIERRDKFIPFLELQRKMRPTAESQISKLLNDSERWKELSQYFVGVLDQNRIRLVSLDYQEEILLQAGQHRRSNWSRHFYHNVIHKTDGEALLSINSFLDEKLMYLTEDLWQTIRLQFQESTMNNEFFEKLRLNIESLPSVQQLRSTQSGLDEDDAIAFANAWDEQEFKFRSEFNHWVANQAAGRGGAQEIPLEPRRPTGRYSLSQENKKSLFVKEYLQSSYEERMATYLEGCKTFESQSEEIKNLNGSTVLCWTTNHGIEIPMPEKTKYIPDFLIALSLDGQTVWRWLLLETKGENLDPTDVQAKKEAAKAFCDQFKDVSYAVFYGNDILSCELGSRHNEKTKSQ